MSQPKQLPSLSYLNDCFDYDSSTGELTWKTRPRSHFNCNRGMKVFNTQNSGVVAGNENAMGYLVVNITLWKNGFKRMHTFKCHRIAYALANNVLPTVDQDVLHRNGIRSHNGAANLTIKDAV